jgi:TRAP-type mannitol/chloroaromatic compound transport system permease small subunit
MTSLFLSAFYDKVNTSVGPTIMWILLILMVVELIYVMAKYLSSTDQK